MKAPVSAAIMLLMAASAASAQDAGPRPEVGFRSGVSVFREDGYSFTLVSIPNGGLYFTPATVYLTLFPRETLGVEPQFGLTYARSDGSGLGALSAGLQVNQFARDATENSPFGFLTGGIVAPIGEGAGEVLWVFGGGAGYRMIVRESLGVRIEGRYRRLRFSGDDGTNEFSLLVGLGALIGSN